MTWFYYLDEQDGLTELIRVKARRRPSFDAAATWHPVQELIDGRWQPAAFSELTWATLVRLTHIGSTSPS